MSTDGYDLFYWEYNKKQLKKSEQDWEEKSAHKREGGIRLPFLLPSSLTLLQLMFIHTVYFVAV